jgi:hypothetical protein
MTTDLNGNEHAPKGSPKAGQFIGKHHSEPDVTLPAFDSSSFDPDIVRSRRALIDVLNALSEQKEALTVLGAHAVIEVTQNVPNLPPDDSTRDGDLGVAPALLSNEPLLTDALTALGYEPAHPDRPGVWSLVSQRQYELHSRDTIDLIAPYEVSYAEGTRPPRRGARVGLHGERAVSATRGTELTLVDRELREIRSFDSSLGTTGYVAGPSALLCAKAYKLHDRMDEKELARNPQRLRPKDFADVYRLILSVDPDVASGVFDRGTKVDRIGPAVALGRQYLEGILADDEYMASQVADAWQDPFREQEMASVIGAWLHRFKG